MSLDVENKFSIISPTHDFKIVTRLQHVTQPLWAMSSAAEKKRMAETFLGQWRRRQLMSSVYLLADCIESGHMPGDLHAIMSTAPFKNLNLTLPCASKWRGKCQSPCKDLGHRDQEHSRPGRSICWRHSNAIQCNMFPGSGQERISNVRAEGGAKGKKQRLLRTQEPGTQVQNRHLPMTTKLLPSQWNTRCERVKVPAISNCPKAAQSCRRVLWGRGVFFLLLTGIRQLMQLVLIQISAIDIYLVYIIYYI